MGGRKKGESSGGTNGELGVLAVSAGTGNKPLLQNRPPSPMQPQMLMRVGFLTCETDDQEQGGKGESHTPHIQGYQAVAPLVNILNDTELSSMSPWELAGEGRSWEVREQVRP